MPEHMKWSEMTPFERDQLVSEKIFGWPDQPLAPEYSRNMSDAWLVVRMMNNPQSPAFPDYQDYACFIDALTEIVGSDLFFDLFYCDADGDHLTPERICLAALKAIGADIEE